MTLVARLIQIYNEKEQAEKGKNTGCTRVQNWREKENYAECKQITGKPDAVGNKGSGHLKERPRPAKFPNYEKKLRKRLALV